MFYFVKHIPGLEVGQSVAAENASSIAITDGRRSGGADAAAQVKAKLVWKCSS